MPGALAGLGYLLLGIDVIRSAIAEMERKGSGSGDAGSSGAAPRRLPPPRGWRPNGAVPVAVAGVGPVGFLGGTDRRAVHRLGLGVEIAPMGSMLPQAPRYRDPQYVSLDRISADAMRHVSPVFGANGDRPPRATRHPSMESLAGRVKKIREQMRKGALDPAVRRTAIAVLSRRCGDKPGGWCIAEKDWMGEARALFQFTRANVRYTKDPTLADTYVHPARTLFDVRRGSGGGGDCDDYTATLGALLMAVGHEPKIRVVAVKNPGDPNPNWNHIYLVDRIMDADGRPRDFVLDASVSHPAGWEAPKDRIVRFKDFDV